MNREKKLYLQMNAVAKILKRDEDTEWIQNQASCKFGDISPDCDSRLRDTWAIEYYSLLNLLKTLGSEARELYNVFNDTLVTMYKEVGYIQNERRLLTSFFLANATPVATSPDTTTRNIRRQRRPKRSSPYQG